MSNVGITCFEATSGQPGYDALAALMHAAAASDRPFAALAGRRASEDAYVEEASCETREGGISLRVRTRHGVLALWAAREMSAAHPTVRILCSGHYDCEEGMTAEAWLGGDALYSVGLLTDGTVGVRAYPVPDGTPGQADGGEVRYGLVRGGGIEEAAAAEHLRSSGLHAMLAALPGGPGNGWRHTVWPEEASLARPRTDGLWDLLLPADGTGEVRIVYGVDDDGSYGSERTETEGWAEEALEGVRGLLAHARAADAARWAAAVAADPEEDGVTF